MVGEPNKILKWESALDWVTLSSPLGIEEGVAFAAVVRKMQRRQTDFGGIPAELRAGAYKGTKVGKWSFLQRPFDGHQIITVEGSDAEAALTEMEEADIAYRVTRIDAQFTGWHQRPQKDRAQELCETIRCFWEKKKRLNRVPIATFSNSIADTGITIGSRTSAIYCRIYDWEAKHASETYHHLWRYEIEAKEEAAKQLSRGWLNASRKTQFCANVVDTRLRKYGIELDMSGKLSGYPLAGTKGRGDVESKMKHLRKAVCPFLAQLMVEAGEEAVLKVLRDHLILK